MKNIIALLCLLLLVACKNTPPAGQTVEKTPEALQHLPVGTEIDLGDGYKSTIISEDKILHERPGQPKAYRKCKNCGNTILTDNSKVKETGDVKIKDQHRLDNSSWKDAKQDNRQDNRINPPDKTIGFIDRLKGILVFIFAIGGVVLLLLLFLKR